MSSRRKESQQKIMLSLGCKMTVTRNGVVDLCDFRAFSLGCITQCPLDDDDDTHPLHQDNALLYKSVGVKQTTTFGTGISKPPQHMFGHEKPAINVEL